MASLRISIPIGLLVARGLDDCEYPPLVRTLSALCQQFVTCTRPRVATGENALRRQIATDSHPPGEYRSDAVRNVEWWYKAYEIAPDDRLYLKSEDRVRIW